MNFARIDSWQILTGETFSLFLFHEIMYFLQLAAISLVRLVTNSCLCCGVNAEFNIEGS